MKNKLNIFQNSNSWIFLLLLPLLIFFYPVFLKGRMPIPADTIVGLYHPLRDVVWKNYSAGVPFKNFLITDAVRQQYPWRKLALEIVKRGEYPGWNPYTHAGTPLAANMQTALFYPLNVFYLFLPFNFVWTVQVISQPILLALFMVLYLREMGISKKASVIASLSLAISGFSVAWLEWNTTLHTLVWLPLALLAVEKIFSARSFKWLAVLTFSLISIFFAGFMQTAFYAYVLITGYIVYKLLLFRKKKEIKKRIFEFSFVSLLVFLITSIQWLPFFNLISDSARKLDLGDVLSKEDWFIPLKHLAQFIAPDYFGNPATLNYWGIFNYTEFIGYIGIIPLLFAILSVFPRKNKNGNKYFFWLILLTSLVFATPNPIARIPFQFSLPLISTAQPSRLMLLIDFSLVVLAAYGLDYLFSALSSRHYRIFLKRILAITSLISIILGFLWLFTSMGTQLLSASKDNLLVSQRNLILPTLIWTVFIISSGVIMFAKKFKIKIKILRLNLVTWLIFFLLYSLISFDLLRFAWKFTPFSDSDFLYPSTKAIKFLQSDTEVFRYMTTDRRILPPNFSIAYKLQTIEGYDPIYLERFGQLVTSIEKGESSLDLIPFHRILRPHNYQSPAIDLLNVKYILSLSEIQNPKLTKVFQEGQTRIYRNENAFPRAFMVKDYEIQGDLEEIGKIFNLKRENILETVKINYYSENQVSMTVESDIEGMVVLADTYYPAWKAEVDGKPVEIYRVFYALRGTIVSPGRHEINYYYSQL